MNNQAPAWLTDAVERIEQRFADLEAAMQTTNNAVPDRGARPMPFEAGRRTKLATSGGTLVGFSVRETTALDYALVHLCDGDSADADIVAIISLAPNESVRDWFGNPGVSLYNGLYLHVVEGEVDGVAYLGGVG